MNNLKISFWHLFIVMMVVGEMCWAGVVFPGEDDEEDGSTFGQEEMDAKQKNCWDNGQLYWSATDQCYKPASQGPCGRSEWIVLVGDPSVAANVQCRPRSCPKADQVSVDGQCHSLRAEICRDNEILATNPSGSGQCVCRESHSLWPADRMCYPLYRQGPCSSGQYLVIHPVSHDPDCVANTCEKDGQVPFEGSCHALGAPEACTASSTSTAELIVDPSSLKPACQEPVISLRQVAIAGYNCGKKSPLRNTSFCRKPWTFGY